jgi:hypothetical protein
MRVHFILLGLILSLATAVGQPARNPFPDYKPDELSRLYHQQHDLELKIWELINQAAALHDKSLKYDIDLYGNDMGYIPLVAVAHYKWVFGDKSKLDWLLAEDKKWGLGGNTITLATLGYMDEWDRTIKRLKEREAYLSKSPGGETSLVLYQAIEMRKRIYGKERFERAWKAINIK